VTTRLPAAALAAVAALAGCGGGGSVSGKVTLDGEPLPSGTVTFHPVGPGPAAIGTIGSGGRYELAIGGDRTVPPGDYLVTVDATEAVTSEPPAAPGKGPPPPPKPPRRLTPARYADKDTTDLRFTLKPGSNTIDLRLKKGCRICPARRRRAPAGTQ
jgi:hypothetical protein